MVNEYTYLLAVFLAPIIRRIQGLVGGRGKGPGFGARLGPGLIIMITGEARTHRCAVFVREAAMGWPEHAAEAKVLPMPRWEDRAKK